VRAGALESSSLVARRVGSTSLALFAAPSYLRKHRRPRALADLAQHACIIYRGNASGTVWRLSGPRGEESVTVEGPLSADDMSFCRAAAIAGAGIVLMPVLLILDAVDDGRLEQVLPEYSIAGQPIHVVMPSTRYLPTRVALLRDFLVELMTRRLNEAHTRCHAQTTRRRDPRETSG
jgi:DNA-binding transcriptional LysR family regulator